MPSWLKTPEQMNDEVQSTFQSNWKSKPNRFYLKLGTSAKLVFVDDVPASIYEHEARTIEDYRVYITCTGESDVLCCEKYGRNRKTEGSSGRYSAYYYTVVDTSEYRDKRGRSHSYEMKLFPAKWKTFSNLNMKREERMKEFNKGFADHIVVARRFNDQTEPKVGSEFEIQREVGDPKGLFEKTVFNGTSLTSLYDEAEKSAEKMEELKRLFSVRFDAEGRLVRRVPAFNYENVLAPLSRAEIEALPDKDADVQPKKQQASATDDIPF